MLHEQACERLVLRRSRVIELMVLVDPKVIVFNLIVSDRGEQEEFGIKGASLIVSSVLLWNRANAFQLCPASLLSLPDSINTVLGKLLH